MRLFETHVVVRVRLVPENELLKRSRCFATFKWCSFLGRIQSRSNAWQPLADKGLQLCYSSVETIYLWFWIPLEKIVLGESHAFSSGRTDSTERVAQREHRYSFHWRG
jgi:hypothetical protein